MSGRIVFFTISLVFGFFIVAGCSKESPVVEKKFTSVALSAFTVEPYRFRVTMSDEVLTDSLLTPEGQVGKEILFSDYRQRIRVYNTSDETLLIDTPYTLTIGKINAFTIYQTQAGTTPFYLAPPSTEPLPAAGKTKFSLACTGDQFPDSVRVITEVQNAGVTPKDTAVVKNNSFTKYFEVPNSASIKVTLYKLPGGQLYGNRTFAPSELNSDFTIYRLVYKGSASLVASKLY